MIIKDTIEDEINQVLKTKYHLQGFEFHIESSKNKAHGDYATNAAMVLASILKRDPMEIAEEIAGFMKTGNKLFGKIEAVRPGFINFYLSRDFLKNELNKMLKKGDEYGRVNIGKGKRAVVDYSAPNIAKKMHVGHLRSTIIGAAICNVHRFLGYKVIGDNHLGDWGTQFGKLIYMYKQKYGKKIKEDIKLEEMEKMYIDFHQKVKKNSSLEEKARLELKKLQDKDRFNYKLWQLFYEVSIGEFKRIYKILEVHFDTWHGESFYDYMLNDIVEQALGKGIAKESRGAVVIPLEKYDLPDFLIQKSDKAFLYSTTDLATIKYRHEQYRPAKNIYVVASQQELHFKQLFKSSQLLGLSSDEHMMHIKFGLILGANGKKMSTREGEAVDLEDIINQGIGKAKKRISRKNPNLSGKELDSTARILALGAIKYNDLSQNRLTDIRFDWDKMLSLESGSSPYLQYTYVRIKSIFNRGKVDLEKIKKKIDLNLLKEDIELKIIRDLVKFPEAVKSSSDECKLNLIAIYLEELAKDFHVFYENLSVLQAADDLSRARLGLLEAIAVTIKSGLLLLGIHVPKKM
ncbi:MAG: arginine--tRNA ligase [Candidatus Kuenenbacteria bacterium]